MATASLVGNTGATSKEQNFAAVIGEDLVLTYTVTDAADAAVNINGYTISWVMFTHPLSAVAAALTIAGAVVGDGSAGQFTVTVADTATDSLEPRVYHHEAKITSGGPVESIVAIGTADWRPAQT